MTAVRAGAAVIADTDGKLLGIFTHGDFARHFQNDPKVGERLVADLMTLNPVSVHKDKLAVEVLNLLESHRIDDLVVVDDNNAPVGIVDSQDLTRLEAVIMDRQLALMLVTMLGDAYSIMSTSSVSLQTADSCSKQVRVAQSALFSIPPSTDFTLLPKMAAANDLRKGMAIKYNGNTAIVLEVHHRTPGNLRAFVQAIIRYINTGKSADVRFGSTDKVELVDINRATLEFSYKDHNGLSFHGSGNVRDRDVAGESARRCQRFPGGEFAGASSLRRRQSGAGGTCRRRSA